jgi:hypothetical protein
MKSRKKLFYSFVLSMILSIGYSQTGVGNFIFNGEINSIVSNSNGDTYIGGSFSEVTAYSGTGVKFNASNASFSLSDVKIDGPIYCVIPIPGGGWYIGGYFNFIDGIERKNIARINADGTLHSFNPKLNGIAYDLALDITGNLYVGGSFTTIDGNITRNRLAKFNPDGSLSSFNPNINGTVWNVELDNLGNLYVGGSFSLIGNLSSRKSLAKFNNDGTLSSFNPIFSLADKVYEIKFDAAGDLYVGGNFDIVNGQTRNNLVKFNSDGTLNSFSVSLDNDVKALTFASDGSLFIGGRFTSVNGISRNMFVKLNPDGTFNNFNLGLSSNSQEISSIKIDNQGNLYIGGSFFYFNSGQTIQNFVKVSPSGIHTPFITKLNNRVNSIALDDFGFLFVGGSFNTFGSGSVRNNLAKINFDGTLSTFNPNLSNSVKSLAIDNQDNLYAVGFFTQIGDSVRTRIAKFNADGTLNIEFKPSINNGSALSLAVDELQAVYIGGSFTEINEGITRNNFAKFNSDGSLSDFDPNLNGIVRSVVLDSDKSVYLGGSFSLIDLTTDRNHFAKFDSTGNLTSFNPNFDASVYSLAIDKSGYVYVGGAFTTVDYLTNRDNFAKFNPDGSINSLNISLGGLVKTIAVDAVGSIYVGGSFYFNYGGVYVSNIAKFNSSGSLDSLLFNFDFDYNVNSILIDHFGAMHVGGDFFGKYFKYNCATKPVIFKHTSDERCGGGAISISAMKSEGIVNWFDQAIGGNLIATGDTLSIPNLQSSKIFYAEVQNGSCKSESRTSVTATIIENCTQIKDTQCGTVIVNENTKIWTDSVHNASSYKFEITDSNGVVFILENVDRFFTFSQVPYMNYTTYSIRSAGKVDGLYVNFGDSCLLTVGIQSQIQNKQCGITLETADMKIYAKNISEATDYKFEITDPNGQVVVLEDTNRWFKFSQFAYKPYLDYSIRVAFKKNDVYSEFGPACIVRSPIVYFEAYPNPSNGDFTVVSAIPGTFNIINELGQIIRIIEITEANNNQVQIEDLPNGAYFVMGTPNGNVVTKKVIVVR